MSENTYRPPDVTWTAQRKCAVWLQSCLLHGWKVEHLDRLESLWWKYHDRLGNLKEKP
jgi:hypothetical protein